MFGRILRRTLAAFGFLALFAGVAQAGPVIIGGDDLTDHGNASPYGVTNLLGWLYIEKAIGNLASNVTRPGNNGSIAALGSAPSLVASGNVPDADVASNVSPASSDMTASSSPLTEYSTASSTMETWGVPRAPRFIST